MVINFIQDIPTPHNNTLLRALLGVPGIELKLWYAQETLPQYSFTPELAHEIRKAEIYGHKYPSLKLIVHSLLFRKEKYFIVGWANPTTRFLVFLFCVLRLPFNMWFDYPLENVGRPVFKKWLRITYYNLLKISRVQVFCVGKHTIDYFLQRGFDIGKLCNLPIFVDIIKKKSDYFFKKDRIYKKYHLSDDDIFITSGSRLIYEKGFDLLIDAVSKLSLQIKKRMKILIVGRGEEKTRLVALVGRMNLEQNIFFEDWMDIEEFRSCIAVSDIFVHPARFDAYGGGTLNAMPVGTPVIGTYQGGSSQERIENGVNGWLYDSADTDRLAELLSYCFNNKEALASMGEAARKTAETWAPEIGAQIILENIV